MGNLPFYRGSLSLGGPIIQMMDHVQYMMLCQLWMPGHGECEASIEISAEAAEKLGSSHGYALNIKTMPRWSHDGCQFVEDAEGRYEDMVFTHEKFDHWTATLRYDRTR